MSENDMAVANAPVDASNAKSAIEGASGDARAAAAVPALSLIHI